MKREGIAWAPRAVFRQPTMVPKMESDIFCGSIEHFGSYVILAPSDPSLYFYTYVSKLNNTG